MESSEDVFNCRDCSKAQWHVSRLRRSLKPLLYDFLKKHKKKILKLIIIIDQLIYLEGVWSIFEKVIPVISGFGQILGRPPT